MNVLVMLYARKRGGPGGRSSGSPTAPLHAPPGSRDREDRGAARAGAAREELRESLPRRRREEIAHGATMARVISARKVADLDWTTWVPRDRATLVFVVRDGEILLMRKKRGLGAGKINGPGGRLEPGETLLACAVREVQEELCVTPRDLRYAGDNAFQFVDGYSIHVSVYVATGFDGTPAETAEAAPLWFALDAIPYDEMWEDDRLWLPLALSGERFTARYVFDGDRMLDHAIDLV